MKKVFGVSAIELVVFMAAVVAFMLLCAWVYNGVVPAYQ